MYSSSTEMEELKLFPMMWVLPQRRTKKNLGSTKISTDNHWCESTG